MQLDNTRIAIRERNLLETLDLSFRVLREFWKPWLICSLLAIVPLALLNALLLNWMAVEVDFADFDVNIFTDSKDYPYRCIRMIDFFIYFGATLASVFVVADLGPAIFMDNPKVKAVVWDALKQFPAVILCQLLMRGILPLWLLALTFDRVEPNYWVEFALLFFFMFPYVTFMLAFRPYINTIVV